MDSDKAESLLLDEAWLIKLGGWQRIKGSVGLFLCPQGVVRLLSSESRKLTYINCQVSMCVGQTTCGLSLKEARLMRLLDSGSLRAEMTARAAAFPRGQGQPVSQWATGSQRDCHL